MNKTKLRVYTNNNIIFHKKPYYQNKETLERWVFQYFTIYRKLVFKI